VSDIVFQDREDPSDLRPIAANFVRNGQAGHITFDYLIDASGNKGIMSTKVRMRCFRSAAMRLLMVMYRT
jgi:hypothetical protein